MHKQGANWFSKQLRLLNNKKMRLFMLAENNKLSVSWLRNRKCDTDYQLLLKYTLRHFFRRLVVFCTKYPRRFWRVDDRSGHPEMSRIDNNGVSVTQPASVTPV